MNATPTQCYFNIAPILLFHCFNNVLQCKLNINTMLFQHCINTLGAILHAYCISIWNQYQSNIVCRSPQYCIGLQYCFDIDSSLWQCCIMVVSNVYTILSNIAFLHCYNIGFKLYPNEFRVQHCSILHV